MTKYLPRLMARRIAGALGSMPVVVLTGMRQTGKSTFLQKQKELKDRRYVTLDDYDQLEAARKDPDGLLSADRPIIIDEVQRVPELLIAVKRAVDRNRRPGFFLLSGSANLFLLKGVTESLAGRAIYYQMHPFCREEKGLALRSTTFIERCFQGDAPSSSMRGSPVSEEEILSGGMPSVFLGETAERGEWFKGFIQTYLERDIHQLGRVTDIIEFRNLLQLAALRTGSLLTLSQLGRDGKLTTRTTGEYLSILEASFVIRRVPPYLMNRASRVVKSPKIYFSDSGLVCFLAGVSRLDREPLKGAMLETYVAQNLAALIEASSRRMSLHFWNVQGRYEVDFVVESGRECVAIEVKGSPRWEDKDLSALKVFLASTPHCTLGILAYNGTEAVKLGERLWALPLGLVLS